jgi:hypothetical protein
LHLLSCLLRLALDMTVSQTFLILTALVVFRHVSGIFWNVLNWDLFKAVDLDHVCLGGRAERKSTILRALRQVYTLPLPSPVKF